MHIVPVIQICTCNIVIMYVVPRSKLFTIGQPRHDTSKLLSQSMAQIPKHGGITRLWTKLVRVNIPRSPFQITSRIPKVKDHCYRRWSIYKGLDINKHQLSNFKSASITFLPDNFALVCTLIFVSWVNLDSTCRFLDRDVT